VFEAAVAAICCFHYEIHLRNRRNLRFQRSWRVRRAMSSPPIPVKNPL